MTRIEATPPDDLFLTLTPHKVLAAVEAAGLSCTGLCYTLNSFENRVFEVECEDRTRVVAKFYRPNRWTREQIVEEHRFIAELEEAEVPVAGTYAFPSGVTVEYVDDHIAYCLFRRLGGRAPEELDGAAAGRLGALVARMHNVGAATEATHRVRLSGDALARSGLAWLRDRDVVPVRCRERYYAAANAIADIADARLRGSEMHRIHGDLHAGNLLLREGVYHLVDFDDMMVGPPVQDLWLLFPGRDAESQALREAFIEAYERFRKFDRASLRLIEPLRGLRMIHYASWLARRWHDPIFPRTFVHFGTEAYWREQTSDLEELLDVIRSVN